MVVPLGPGKFYGSSLPRPRIYTDVKFNADRVDPPMPVMDPFLSWAQEAHWSMGGLSFKRLRFQGRIEGNVNKLSKFREKQAKIQSPKGPDHRKRSGSASPPSAPKITKRRRFMDLFDDESEVSEEQNIAEKVETSGKKKPVRKLVGDFEKVANEAAVGVKTRRSGGDGVGTVVMQVVEELNRENSMEKKVISGKKSKHDRQSRSSPVNGVRVSPRLAKQRYSLNLC